MMKDLWPFGAVLRGMVSNRLELRWLKTVVVCVEEKAHLMCQVGTEKVSASESLLKCRKLIRWHQNRGCRYVSGRSLTDIPFTGQAVSGMEATRARSAASTCNLGRRA